ncbi:MAG: hypothetical protein HGA75_02420 [Thiobacillus sp.]|nr:hypothetical protein [Thiobacillus sp.]
MAAAGASTGPSLHRPFRAKFEESLTREALGRVGPILQRADEKGAATVMFLALVELQKSYPRLPGHDLEVLLKYVMKQGGYL